MPHTELHSRQVESIPMPKIRGGGMKPGTWKTEVSIIVQYLFLILISNVQIRFLQICLYVLHKFVDNKFI